MNYFVMNDYFCPFWCCTTKTAHTHISDFCEACRFLDVLVASTQTLQQVILCSHVGNA